METTPDKALHNAFDKTFSRIIVPLDGSPRARGAVPVAVQLARHLGVPITLLSVVDNDAGLFRVSDDDVESVLACYGRDLVVEARVRDLGPDGDADLPVEVAVELVNAAANDDALLCMSPHGHGTIGQVMFGSVCEEVLRLSAAPVLVVGPSADTRRSIVGPIVACLDGSHFAESVLPASSSWAATVGTSLRLVSVIGPDAVAEGQRLISGDFISGDYLPELAATLPGDVEWTVLHGTNPAKEITRLAGDSAVGVLAVSTHGRTGWRRISIGSVAMRIIHRSPCPVLVVRSRSLEP